MDIEPLKNILEWSENKKETLLYYFTNDVKKKVINLEYEEDKLYVKIFLPQYSSIVNI